MMPPTKKVLLSIGSPGAMTLATTRSVLASCALLWWWITNTEWMGGPFLQR